VLSLWQSALGGCNEDLLGPEPLIKFSSKSLILRTTISRTSLKWNVQQIARREWQHHGSNMGGMYLDGHEGYRDDFGADSTVLDEGNSMWPFVLKGE
jgi:hypothetical protein